ncbi:MAG: hypothetical protein HY707_10520 [Ignavibacteriae bacterium]|nr:hypothetical protein [Ignavibacteriota bacterium]
MYFTPLKHTFRLLILALISISFKLTVIAGERLITELRDFTQEEIKSAGFILPSELRIHIKALGGGEDNITYPNIRMFAYGWIINADTREQVWVMEYDNTIRVKDDRRFDGEISLAKGNYEVYFTAFGITSHRMFMKSNVLTNIDRRDERVIKEMPRSKGFFSWFDDLWGANLYKEWKRRSKNWGIELYVKDTDPPVKTFTPPKEFPYTLFQAVRLGEYAHIKQGFTLIKPIALRIYTIGEMVGNDELADYGWIIDAQTRRRQWEMRPEKLRHAGGAEKNVKLSDIVSFPAGDYILYYITDDSHSFVDWNNAPPVDPYNFGITLLATRNEDRENFMLSPVTENQNIIVQLTHIGDDESRNASFKLKNETQLRVYALGERGHSRRQMADYGWIINTTTREKVWTMDVERTQHAGGAEKNRMIDEAIMLPHGTYTVYYQTDDSHAYDDWNAQPPFDPEHWGITIYGEGTNFSLADVEKNITPRETGIIAQIARVTDNANRSEKFRLDKPTRIRVYAIGEGQNREMFDYGWIQHAVTGQIIWEMTYSMTFHAGGGRKNRIVKTTVLLDSGEYELHYVTDDSHSFNHWNTDPPDDPTMWGITLYKEK